MMTLFLYFSPSQFLLLVDAGFLDVRLEPGEVFVVDGAVSVVGEVVVSVVAALAVDDLNTNCLLVLSISFICVDSDLGRGPLVSPERKILIKL